MNVIYKNKETGQAWAKRFIVERFILDKVYRYVDENAELQYISSDVEPEVEILFVPKAKQKVPSLVYPLKEVLVKGAQARGIRVANQAVKKVSHLNGKAKKARQLELDL